MVVVVVVAYHILRCHKIASRYVCTCYSVFISLILLSLLCLFVCISGASE